jgi:hypothetical protein
MRTRTGTDISALPDGLSVGGYLDLNRTKITALPEGLKVGGKIFSCPIDVNLIAPLYPGFGAMQKHTDEGFRVALCRRVTGNGRERSCSVV